MVFFFDHLIQKENSIHLCYLHLCLQATLLLLDSSETTVWYYTVWLDVILNIPNEWNKTVTQNNLNTTLCSLKKKSNGDRGFFFFFFFSLVHAIFKQNCSDDYSCMTSVYGVLIHNNKSYLRKILICPICLLTNQGYWKTEYNCFCCHEWEQLKKTHRRYNFETVDFFL